jgi:hypothetical protein
MSKAIALAGSFGILVGGWALIASWDGPFAHAQSGRAKSTKKANVRSLDIQADRTISSFVRDAASLAKEYEEAGHFEKAKRMYESILNVNPDASGIQERLRAAEESILSSNETEIEIDAARGWGASQVRVFKGRAVRMQARGSYRFITSLDLGPEGFPTEDPARGHMAEGVPCGALMAALVTDGKPGKPFTVGAGREFTPDEDGLLFFKLNVPPGARCTGKVQVRLSGYVLPSQP